MGLGSHLRAEAAEK